MEYEIPGTSDLVLDTARLFVETCVESMITRLAGNGPIGILQA